MPQLYELTASEAAARIRARDLSPVELMEALLKAGAEVNARMAYNSWHVTMGDGQLHVDWMGATPFFRAAHAMDIPAMRLLARRQGAATLANAFNNEKFIEQEVKQMCDWVNSCAGGNPG